ncbi:transglycosylase SLT domain-containing protein [Gemmatimonas sp.]|uniref:lytic transglycosylase domain-containing protein n=1 Tax=Gemmatimonas sp. TaxID=1962908 RepID=UPI0037C01AFF
MNLPTAPSAGPLPLVCAARRGARASLLAVLVVLPACRGLRPTPVPSSVAPAPAVVAGVASAARVTPPPADPATPEEVVRTAIAVFGDSTAATVADSSGEEPVWDIDVRSYETHDRVEHYVELFSNKARERFQSRLSRGTRYEPMIRAKLRASGMPEDLTYLALIESGYDPHAYSRAAAVGMWQFMSSTARDVGMRVDWWMDERRDPARATDGAIRFLGFLQKQFGSFYLAAAAYNGGPGRVSRGLTRFADELEGAEGEDRFFALAEQDFLRAETKNYVPQLIAAALVAKKPDQYGLRIDSLPTYAYDSLRVAAGTSLAALAAAGNLPGSTLRDLNPALLRGITPPDADIWLRVPVGMSESLRAAIDTVPPEALRGFRAVRLDEAMSASGFASRHGVSLKQLRWFNPTWRISRKGRLTAGQTLRVPQEAALSFARDIPDPSLEKFGGPSGTKGLSARGVHVVRRGETLGAIARRYGLTESQLKAMNGLRGSRILAGQTLQIRKSTVSERSGKNVTSSKAKSQKSRVKKPVEKPAPAKKKATSKPRKAASSKVKKKK